MAPPSETFTATLLLLSPPEFEETNNEAFSIFLLGTTDAKFTFFLAYESSCFPLPVQIK